MTRDYKRIIEVTSAKVTDLQSWNGYADVLVRKARNSPEGVTNEWVIEGPHSERRVVDKIVQMFSAV